MNQTFLERPTEVSEDQIDELQDLLRKKVNLKTGYAEAYGNSRALNTALRSLDLSDDGFLDRDAFRSVMLKMNCGHDKPIVDAMFHRYDTKGKGRLSMKEFSEQVFGIKRVPNADPECRDVIKLVRRKLLSRGGENGYRGLVRVLRILDDNGNRVLDRAELKNGLQTYGIELTDYELKTIMHFFDSDGNGGISVTEFVVGLRPRISESRQALIRQAFLRLDKNPDGRVTMKELSSMYRADKHPAVIKGTMTPEEVIHQFASAWNKNGDSEITEDEFMDYYKDISSTIDNDNYFELMIRNAWHITGGSGRAANTSNLRVLVTHLDGSQCVEVIENDLGVDSNDTDTLIMLLRKQGVTDILKVETAY